jgi:hypothetical protein
MNSELIRWYFLINQQWNKSLYLIDIQQILFFMAKNNEIIKKFVLSLHAFLKSSISTPSNYE